SECIRNPGELRNWIVSCDGGSAAASGGVVRWLPWACTAPAKLTAERINHRTIRTVNENLIDRKPAPARVRMATAAAPAGVRKPRADGTDTVLYRSRAPAPPAPGAADATKLYCPPRRHL